MEIKTNYIGAYGGNAASIIELIVTSNGTTITEEVTGFDSKIPVNLIFDLREIADELERQNELIAEL